ncbi:MAG: peroxiredoxin [Pseudomonadales bacterium]|nr:peroxiredoxin [Pseudomonadales bacterium]
MRHHHTNLVACAGLLLILAVSSSAFASTLAVGDRAPDFELQGSDGQTYRLSDFRGREAVVLAWFPKAYTSGCTIECKSLAQNGHLLRKYAVSYFMASVDPLADNVGFAKEQNADFPLLSDPEKTVAAAYGVLTARGYAARHTFYIDVDGNIAAIDTAVRPETSAEDMAATLGRLGVARR